MVPIWVSEPIGLRQSLADGHHAGDGGGADGAEADEQHAEFAASQGRSAVVKSQSGGSGQQYRFHQTALGCVRYVCASRFLNAVSYWLVEFRLAWHIGPISEAVSVQGY